MKTYYINFAIDDEGQTVTVKMTLETVKQFCKILIVGGIDNILVIDKALHDEGCYDPVILAYSNGVWSD